MKIVLVNPPSIGSQYINRDLMGGMGVNLGRREKVAEKLMGFLKAKSIRLPVLSLVYSLSVLAEYCEVAAVDAANLDLSVEQTIAEVVRHRPDWVLSTTSISALPEEIKMLAAIKSSIPVLVGLLGDAATHLSKMVMEQPQIDFIVRGDEPEATLQEIIQKKDFRGVKGVIYRENGQVVDSGDPGMNPNLDQLPFPKWEYFPIHRYRYFPILRKTPFVPILSTRGCPYGCIYCPYTSNQGLKYRYRSVGNVLEELVRAKEKYGAKAVQFRDPTFTLKKDRTAEICDGIIQKKLGLEWGCETRVDCLDEALVDKMVAAGCRGVNIGIESSDPNVIRNVKRGWIDPNHIRKMVRHMHANGIRVSGFFIIGLPGENRETVQNTIALAKELPLSYVEFKTATPFPGTPLFDLAQKEGWISDIKVEQYTSYMPSMRISPEMSPEFLQGATGRAYREFYARPGKICQEVFSPGFLSGLTKILVEG